MEGLIRVDEAILFVVVLVSRNACCPSEFVEVGYVRKFLSWERLQSSLVFFHRVIWRITAGGRRLNCVDKQRWGAVVSFEVSGPNCRSWGARSPGGVQSGLNHAVVDC